LTRFRRLCFFFLFTFAISGSAFAQTISGRVLDPDSRAVAGADIIISRNGVVIVSSKTMTDGRYGPIELPPGEYDVSAAASGMRAAPSHIAVQESQTATADVHMTLTAVDESVLVSVSQVDVTLSRATDSVSVIDRSDLDVQHTDTVAEALRFVPGLNVIRQGGYGALTSIFPRGGESNYSLVLVDGIPQNMFGGGFDAAHLDTPDVDRVEVVRGAESALYGSGAMSSIVHVITRQGGAPRAEVAFEGGSNDFTRTSGSTTGANGAWRWGASFDRLMTDGDTRVFPSIGRSVANADYDRLMGSGSFGWSDRATRSVRVDVRGDRSDVGYPGPYGTDPSHLYSGLDLISRGHNTSQGIGASGTFGDSRRARHGFQVTWADFKMHYTSPPYGCNPTTCALPPDTSDDRTRRVTGRYQFDREFHAGGVSAGWEALREQVDNTFISGRDAQPVPIVRFDSGLFAEFRPVLGERALVTAGVRVERIQRNALQGDAYGARPDFNESVIWSTNPKLAAAFFVGPAGRSSFTKLHAGFGTGIRPPNGFEIAYTNNPDLKPERNRSVDFGIEHGFAPSLAVEGDYFYNRFDDLIMTVGSSFAGASRYQTDNLGNARAQGVELGLRWRSASGLGARVAWTSLATKVLEVDNSSVVKAAHGPGDELIRRPRQQGFGEITWTADRGSVFLTIGGRGAMVDIDPGTFTTTVENPGYATVSLGASFFIAQRLELFGRVMNALDRSYEEALGYPALGRTANVGVRVRTGK
jgi:outer membrane cobalamin receptor